MVAHHGRADALAKFLNFTMQYPNVFYGAFLTCKNTEDFKATITQVIDWVKNPVNVTTFRYV